MTKEVISTERALKLALEALEFNQANWQGKDKAITALLEALTSVPDWASEAIEQPAGSVYRYGKDSSGKQWHGIKWTASGLDLPDGTLIYTSPQPAEMANHLKLLFAKRTTCQTL